MTTRATIRQTLAVEDPPKTRYARLGESRIAYQVLGDGPLDVVHCPSFGDCTDARWEWPAYSRLLRRLAKFARLIMLDPRGFGASDPPLSRPLSGWEEWTEDARAVLDAVGSERASILACVDSGPTGILFAATQPELTAGLVLVNATARSLIDTDYPWGLTEAESERASAFFR